MSGEEGRWSARPKTAFLVRALVVVVPAVAGALAAWEAAHLLPEPSGLVGTVAWWAALIAVAVVAVVLVQRLARRLLPLAWLLNLTLAFPDRAPSRLATARRAGSRRARRRALAALREDGLGPQAPAAAERALVLVAALGAHDRRTRGHSERVRSLADVLAEEAGVPEGDRDRLRWAALLHDIGKLAVPGEILNKPDRPDEAEWATLRRHPEEGGRLVEPLVAWLGPWAGAVEHHHERWDGSGYPRGLAGEEISLGGRILAVADAYEVMTAARPYKRPLRPDVAREEIVAGASSHFDPTLVRSFLGVALGRLWWVVGASALLAQLPLLGKLWGAPVAARFRQGLSGAATGAAVVAALVVAGVVGPPVGSPAGDKDAEVAATASPSEGAAPAPAGQGAVAPDAPAAPVQEGGRPRAVAAPPAPAAPAGDGGATAPTPGPAPESTGGDEGAADQPTVPHDEDVPHEGGVAYVATGRVLAPGPLAAAGVTEAEFRSACAVPASQGLDAHVFDLPAAVRVGGAPVRVQGDDALGLYDLDVVFYSAECVELGRLAGGGPDEKGTLPAGTRFIVVTERSGIDTAVELFVGPTS